MNTPTRCSKAPIISSLFGLCVVLLGCGQKDQDIVSPALPAPSKKRVVAPITRLQEALDRFHDLPHEHEPARRPRVTSERIADRRDWLLNVLSKGYAASGHTNSGWDEATRQSLAACADYTRRGADARSYSVLTNAVLNAVAQGCDDPMIGYLRLQFGLTGSNYTKEAFALESLGAFRAIVASQYHPLLKFKAGLRAVEAAYAAEPKGDRSPANELVMGCVEDLARDTNAPATDVFECASLWTQFGSGWGWVAFVNSQLEGLIKESWGSDERFFELRGVAEIGRAWQARGGDFADKVTAQGWKDFREHLDNAALALETAWQMNPTNAVTAYNMMQVELGQGQGRARMEKWFNRAMALAPYYYDAAELMSFYLEPRWYGSEDAALEFARSCVSSTNWTGTVPLVLANVHRSLAAFYQRTGGPDHWGQPGVWEDVRSSYEKYFRLYPGDYGYRHNFARDAYSCGRYAEFLEQTKLFAGYTNFTFFGGEDQFRQMLQHAASADGNEK